MNLGVERDFSNCICIVFPKERPALLVETRSWCVDIEAGGWWRGVPRGLLSTLPQSDYLLSMELPKPLENQCSKQRKKKLLWNFHSMAPAQTSTSNLFGESRKRASAMSERQMWVSTNYRFRSKSFPFPKNVLWGIQLHISIFPILDKDDMAVHIKVILQASEVVLTRIWR